MLAKLQDIELMTRVQQEQHNAFDKLISRYEGRLYSMGRCIEALPGCA